MVSNRSDLLSITLLLIFGTFGNNTIQNIFKEYYIII